MSDNSTSNAAQCGCTVAVVRERCPMCGQPTGPWKAARICSVCHKPIRKGHKWRIENSMIRHRVCDDPESYRPEAQPEEGDNGSSPISSRVSNV